MIDDDWEKIWKDPKLKSGSLVYRCCECDNLRSMLIRTLEEIEYQEPGVVLDHDIVEWNKLRKQNETNTI